MKDRTAKTLSLLSGTPKFSERIHAVGHFDINVFIKSLPISDLQYKDIILKKMITMNAWAATYLSNPHESLGRKGPVCPFVPKAIKKQSLFMTYHLCPKNTSIDDIQYIMQAYRQHFKQSNLDKSYHALMIVFIHPNNESTQLSTMIDHAQQKLKPLFLKEGIIIGQFFEGCPVQGIHNEQFRPFNAPVPILGIRKFMPQDLVFITDTSEHMQLYINEFGIKTKESLMVLLRSVCLDKNQKFLAHADILLKKLGNLKLS